MNNLIGGMFTFSDRIKMESLNHRLARNNVVTSNISNAETPGYRAVGYDFEKQLSATYGKDDPFPMKATHPKHYISNKTTSDGKIEADVFLRPTEHIPQDGNTVDVDDEMYRMGRNQILYRTTVELLNRKIGILKYAITSGTR